MIALVSPFIRQSLLQWCLLRWCQNSLEGWGCFVKLYGAVASVLEVTVGYYRQHNLHVS